MRDRPAGRVTGEDDWLTPMTRGDDLTFAGEDEGEVRERRAAD